MTQFFKGALMNLRRLIFGVPTDNDTAAGRNASRQQVQAEQPMYLPASRLTDLQINAVGDDGSTWEEWRTDADGEVWYKRTSNVVHGIEPAAPIMGFVCDELPDDDDEIPADDDDDSLPDDVAAGQLLLRQLVTDDYEAPATAEEALENARLRIAARRYQNRMTSWPMADNPGEELEDDIFGDEEAEDDDE